MARPKKDPDREETPVRIMRAAENAFGERGFARTRLEDVAGKAGVRRPSLLHHFGSKKKLYRAVLERAFAELRDRIEELTSSEASFVALLDEVTRGLLDFAEKRPGVPALVLRELIDPSDAGKDILETDFVPLIDRLEGLVREQGSGLVPATFPVRDAILALFMSHMVRAAAGADAPPLWQGTPDDTAMLIQAVMLGAASQGDIS